MNLKNRLILILGFISLGIGTIGLFVPLLPTTPLVLLAGYLFARSSRKYHDWLRNNRYFGKTLRLWESGEGLSRREKARMIIIAAFFIAVSFIVCTNIVGRIVLILVLPIPISVAVCTKTRKDD